MFSLWLQRLIKFRTFLGPEVWRLFLAAIAVGTLWFFVELSFVYILRGFLSTLGLAPLEDSWLNQYYPKSVLGASLLVVAFGIVRGGVIFVRLYSSLLASQAFQRHQRTLILQTALMNAETESTPEVIALFNDRVSQGAQVIQCLVYLINISTSLALLSVAAFLMTPYEFLIAFAILGAFLLPFRSLNEKVNRASHGLVDEGKRATRSIIMGLRNHFLLRIYGAMTGVIDKGAKSLRDYESHYKTYVAVAAAKTAAPHLIGVIAVGAVTFVSLTWFDTPGIALISFFYLFFRIAQSASDASTYLNEIRVHMAGLKVLYQFNMKTIGPATAITESSPGKGTLDRQEEKVEFHSIEARNLGFRWSSGPWVFRNHDFSLRRGETLLIQGESGAGKSTLLAVLTGLVPAREGQILCDGKPLASISFAEFSAGLGYVGPEPYLIEGTLKDNLLFAHPEPASISKADIEQVLIAVRMAEDVRLLPQGIETALNEFTQLSTGQKQRLSLARAFLRRPRLLVLDEATANLDRDTEEKIIAAIQKDSNQRMTIIVSHRPGFGPMATHTLQLSRLRHEDSADLGPG